MKNIKRSLLALALISTINVFSYYGRGYGYGYRDGYYGDGGAAAAGTAGLVGGLMIGSALGSRNQDPETTNIRSYDQRINKTERALARAERDASKGKSGAQERIERLEAELKRLNKERAMITA